MSNDALPEFEEHSSSFSLVVSKNPMLEILRSPLIVDAAICEHMRVVAGSCELRRFPSAAARCRTCVASRGVGSAPCRQHEEPLAPQYYGQRRVWTTAADIRTLQDGTRNEGVPLSRHARRAHEAVQEVGVKGSETSVEIPAFG